MEKFQKLSRSINHFQTELRNVLPWNHRKMMQSMMSCIEFVAGKFPIDYFRKDRRIGNTLYRRNRNK